MQTIRALATAAAAFAVASMLAHTSAAAEPQGAGVATPLKITSSSAPAKKGQRTATTKSPGHAPLRAAEVGSRNIMRGPDTIGLIARLPWWRTSEMQTIRYRDKEYVSQVLAAADAWLAATTGDPDGLRGDGVVIAVADDVNEINSGVEVVSAVHDLSETAMAAYVPVDAQQTWLQALLAMLGGALAAVSAARYLFA